MEKVLKKLFDYQKFERSPKLAAVIDGVHAELASARELDDDEADIWAAGDPEASMPAYLVRRSENNE